MDLVTPNPYQNNLETISNKIVKFILKILLQEYGTDCLGLVEFRSLLHLLSHGCTYLLCFIFCQGGVNSHNPIGERKKNFQQRVLFFGLGYMKGKNCS